MISTCLPCREGGRGGGRSALWGLCLNYLAGLWDIEPIPTTEIRVVFFFFFLFRAHYGDWLSVQCTRTYMLDPDPHSSACLGSGSCSVLGMRIRIQEHGKLTKMYKWTLFPSFQKGLCTFVGMFFDILPTLSTFCDVKIQLLWLWSLPRIRNRIRMVWFWFGYLDSDPDPQHCM